MSRRRYQHGSVETSGNWWVVRFREYVAGQRNPIPHCERICLIQGPGSLPEWQRKLKAQRIVDASGVNDDFLKDETPNPVAAVTFKEQGEKWRKEDALRKRDPLATGTIDSRYRQLEKWLYPNLGHLPLLEVNNPIVKLLVTKLVKAGLKPATIKDIVGVAKLVVASVVDKEGEQVYPRHWSNKLMDIPRVVKKNQNTPCFNSEIMSGLARWYNRKMRTLFILCAASGLRISEALGLDIGKHFSDDFSTIRVEQQAPRGQISNRLKTESSGREVDLDPRVAAIIKDFAGGRTSGLLFCTRTGKPIYLSHVLKYHLHPALKALGFFNDKTGDHKAGTHACRRYRETHLGKCEGLPHGLRIFWMGHGERDMTDRYDKIREDPITRKYWAERCGIGFDLPSPSIVRAVRNFPEAQTKEDAA